MRPQLHLRHLGPFNPLHSSWLCKGPESVLIGVQQNFWKFVTWWAWTPRNPGPILSYSTAIPQPFWDARAPNQHVKRQSGWGHSPALICAPWGKWGTNAWASRVLCPYPQTISNHLSCLVPAGATHLSCLVWLIWSSMSDLPGCFPVKL